MFASPTLAMTLAQRETDLRATSVKFHAVFVLVQSWLRRVSRAFSAALQKVIFSE